MADLDLIKNKIIQNLTPVYVDVVDLRGGDHIMATIVSTLFENKSMIEQHQMVYALFSCEMSTNEIHALTLKTYTPSRWEKEKLNIKK